MSCPPSETLFYGSVVLRYVERGGCLTAMKLLAETRNKKMAVIVHLALHMSWKVLIRTVQFRDDSGCIYPDIRYWRAYNQERREYILSDVNEHS